MSKTKTNWWESTLGMSEVDKLLYPLVVGACRELGMQFAVTGDKEADAQACGLFWAAYTEAPSSHEATETELIGALRSLTREGELLPWGTVEAERIGPDWIRHYVREVASYIVAHHKDGLTHRVDTWATGNPDAYAELVAGIPHTAESARALVEKLFPDGVPCVPSKDFKKVDWPKLAAVWNKRDFVPPEVVKSFARYAEEGMLTDDFIEAVLENNLVAAIGMANNKNRRFLSNIVRYAYRVLPHGCWGSPSLVDAYIKRKQDEQRKRKEQ